MNTVLVTGATGFVGRALCRRLIEDGRQVRGTFVKLESLDRLVSGVEAVHIDSINATTEWTHALKDVDTVIHLAARVHVVDETALDPLMAFRIVNTEGTRRLGQQAVTAGVRRLVFMSTIGVNGDNSGSHSYTEESPARPHNPYSISKYEAEQSLWDIFTRSRMEVVVVRAPLVYGPENPGNFLSLLRVICSGYPLPLMSVRNRRSLIFIGNLVDALTACSAQPAAAGKTYLVSDNEDVSIRELVQRLGAALGARIRLFPVPTAVINIMGSLLGRGRSAHSLTNSLAVDMSKIQRELGWHPPYTLTEGLWMTCEWFRKQR